MSSTSTNCSPLKLAQPLNEHRNHQLQKLEQVSRNFVLDEPLRLGAREEGGPLREQRRDVLADDLALGVQAVAQLCEALGRQAELGLRYEELVRLGTATRQERERTFARVGSHEAIIRVLRYVLVR